MRISPAFIVPARRRRSRMGLTLPEIMFSIALFSLLSGALIYSNLFGLRMYELTEAKLSAGGDAQLAVGRLTDEIRSSKLTEVGTADFSTFQVISNGTFQAGNAVRIYPSTNLSSFIVYYRDPTDQSLQRRTAAAVKPVRIAGSVTNELVFNAQDHLGNVLTNSQNNRVINLRLDFYQPQSPGPSGGSSRLADYYTIETSVTRRALE